MTKGRILITGASGFTGRHACKHFASIGYEVVAVVRRPGSLEQDLVREVVCNLAHQAQVQLLLMKERPQLLLHLAGLNAVADSWAEPLAYMTGNVMSTLYLIDSLRELGLHSCRVLVAGSMLGPRFQEDDQPQPLHPYSLSKTVQTLVARAWGHLFRLPVMIAQPSNLIGPGRSNGLCGLIGAHLAHLEVSAAGAGTDSLELAPAPFRLSSLTEARDFIDVRDAVHAYEHILHLGEPGHVYPIGSGRLRSLGETAACFESRVAAPVRWLIGADAQKPVSLVQEMDDGLIIDPPLPEKQSSVNTVPMQTLGWYPSIPFEQSVEDILDYFRRNS